MELTDDAFLGGRVQAWQPAKGFRAGLDSVTLAAAVPARPKEQVCELGTGVGVATTFSSTQPVAAYRPSTAAAQLINTRCVQCLLDVVSMLLLQV